MWYYLYTFYIIIQTPSDDTWGGSADSSDQNDDEEDDDEEYAKPPPTKHRRRGGRGSPATSAGNETGSKKAPLNIGAVFARCMSQPVEMRVHMFLYHRVVHCT